MSERKQVTVWVSKTQKDEWQDAVEESNQYSGLSDLIRQSVESEIADANPVEVSQDAPAADNSAEILRAVQSLQTEMEDLSGRLEGVEREVTHSATVHEHQVAALDVVPDAPDDDAENPEEWAVSEEVIGAKVAEVVEGFERDRLETALDGMTEELSYVKCETVDGTDYYYQVV